MSCCCPSGNGGGKQRGSNAAPGKQSMDRELNEDERAVDWWRKRQLSNDENDTMPSRTRSFDNSMSRMQERNPLEKPYSMERNLPLNPQDGNIIQPVLPSREAAPSLPANSDTVEVFEPTMKQPNSLETEESRERLTVLSAEEGPLHTRREASGKNTRTSSSTSKLVEEEAQRAKLDASGIHRKTSSKIARDATKRQDTNKSRQNDDSDHLSDVPSDVDSVTRERYLLACHMLKTTLIEKDKAVVPIEREFILSLLSDYEKHTDEESVVSQDQVSAIEKAQLRLDKDPLFHVQEEPEDFDPLPPMSSASTQMKEDRNDEQMKKQKPPAQPKSMPLQKPLKKFLSNASHACNPRSPEDAGAADIVLIIRDEPEESEETDIDQLVRFDGWSGHKSDEYPFKILGAEDPRVQPRVLTPSVMEALRGFFPFNTSESNFWLKFSLNRDGASLATLLETIRASTYTVIAVETMHGEVFGSFTATPWRTGRKWFGTGEAFLWRLKKSRMTSPKNSRKKDFENEMEVYPYTGYDDLVQYCTTKTIAVGGGDWVRSVSPFDDEPRGIGMMIDGDLAGGETNSCATFANPRLCKKTTASNEFSIANLEVWTLTPCLDVKEASKLEVKKLFVEENLYYEL